MKSTIVQRDWLPGAIISTVFVEPFGYFETAVLRGHSIELIESQIADPKVAEQIHRDAYEQVFWNR